jgi:hypothetical protein
MNPHWTVNMYLEIVDGPVVGTIVGKAKARYSTVLLVHTADGLVGVFDTSPVQAARDHA